VKLGTIFIKLGIALQDCNLIGLYESGMNLVKVAGGQIPAQLVSTGTTSFFEKVEFFAQIFPLHILNPHF
jgi:hypothetical protein